MRKQLLPFVAYLCMAAFWAPPVVAQSVRSHAMADMTAALVANGMQFGEPAAQYLPPDPLTSLASARIATDEIEQFEEGGFRIIGVAALSVINNQPVQASAQLRFELIGDGASAYRISVNNGLNVPVEPNSESVVGSFVSLGAGLTGILLAIRSVRDNDGDDPSAAQLRVSVEPDSGNDTIFGLPRSLALSTNDIYESSALTLSFTDVSTPTAALQAGSEVTPGGAGAAVFAPLRFSEGETRTYEVSLLSGEASLATVSTLTAFHFNLSGEGADAYRISVAQSELPAAPTLQTASIANLSGYVYLRVLSVDDNMYADPPAAVLEVSVVREADVEIENAPLSFALRSVNTDPPPELSALRLDPAQIRLDQAAEPAASLSAEMRIIGVDQYQADFDISESTITYTFTALRGANLELTQTLQPDGTALLNIVLSAIPMDGDLVEMFFEAEGCNCLSLGTIAIGRVPSVPRVLQVTAVNDMLRRPASGAVTVRFRVSVIDNYGAGYGNSVAVSLTATSDDPDAVIEHEDEVEVTMNADGYVEVSVMFTTVLADAMLTLTATREGLTSGSGVVQVLRPQPVIAGLRLENETSITRVISWSRRPPTLRLSAVDQYGEPIALPSRTDVFDVSACQVMDVANECSPVFLARDTYEIFHRDDGTADFLLYTRFDPQIVYARYRVIYLDLSDAAGADVNFVRRTLTLSRLLVDDEQFPSRALEWRGDALQAEWPVSAADQYGNAYPVPGDDLNVALTLPDGASAQAAFGELADDSLTRPLTLSVAAVPLAGALVTMTITAGALQAVMRLDIQYPPRANEVDVDFVSLTDDGGYEIYSGSNVADLRTSTTPDNPDVIALFRISDRGGDGRPAIVNKFQFALIGQTPGASVNINAVRTFNYRLVLDGTEVTEFEHVSIAGGLLHRLRATLDAPLRVPDGESRVYAVEAHYKPGSSSIRGHAAFGFQLNSRFDIETPAGLGGSNLGRLNSGQMFIWHVVRVIFVPDRLRIDEVSGQVDNVKTPGEVNIAGVSPGINLRGQWTDSYGNALAPASVSISDLTARTYSERIQATLSSVGGTRTAIIEQDTSVGTGGVFYDDLEPFYAVLRAMGAEADNSQWTIRLRHFRAGGVYSNTATFTVRIHASALEISDLRLHRPFEHDMQSRLSFGVRPVSIGNLLDADAPALTPMDVTVVAECLPRADDRCESALSVSSDSGATIRPILNSDYVLPSGTEIRLQFRYHSTPTGTLLKGGVGASLLAADSPVSDFAVLPYLVPVAFGQSEYQTTEGDFAATFFSLNFNAVNMPVINQVEIDVEFGEVMTGYSGWAPSIQSPPSGIRTVSFDAQGHRDVSIGLSIETIDDRTYKPSETVALRISALRRDGVVLRIDDDARHRTVISVRDNDTVDINLQAHPARGAAAADPLEAIESALSDGAAEASGYLRLALHETDGQAPYHDANGGAATITLTFSSDTADFAASLLCPDDLRELVLAGADICVRPVAEANYTLSAASGVVTLGYARDGQHEFWLELVAPEDGIDEMREEVRFAVSELSFAGAPWRLGEAAGVVAIDQIAVEFVEASYTLIENQLSGVLQLRLSHPLPAGGSALVARLEFGESVYGGGLEAHSSWRRSLATALAGTTMDVRFEPGEAQVADVDVILTDDSALEPDEIMQVFIRSLADADGGAVNARIGATTKTTLVMRDEDSETLYIGVYADTSEVSRDNLRSRFTAREQEGGGAAAYLRIGRWNISGEPSYDAFGGEGRIRFSFAGAGDSPARAPANLICPRNPLDLLELEEDFCLRPVTGADYVLSHVSTGVVSLSYQRDGAHLFWLEIVAPVDGMSESQETAEFRIESFDLPRSNTLIGPVPGTLSIDNASPSRHDVTFYDVSKDLRDATPGAYPGGGRERDALAAAASLVFLENTSRFYEFEVLDVASRVFKPSGTSLYFELAGAGADAYRLVLGATNENGQPLVPADATAKTATLTLSRDADVGDLLKISATTADPGDAVLRVSRVGGVDIENLPLEFALVTRGEVLEISSLSLQTPLEHDRDSLLAFAAAANENSVLPTDVTLRAACATPAQCSVRVTPTADGAVLRPLLGPGHSSRFGTTLTLTFSYHTGTSMLTTTLTVEDAAPRGIDLSVLPHLTRFSFVDVAHRADEGDDVEIPLRVAFSGPNIALPSFLLRVEFDPVRTGYDGWAPSIERPSVGFEDFAFDAAPTHSLQISIGDDTTYKPNETMTMRIVSARFADGGAMRYEIGDESGARSTATLAVIDNDAVDVNVELFAARDAVVASDPLQVVESAVARNGATEAVGFLRVVLVEADGGAAYHDAAGGVATLTLSFSSVGAQFATTLCPTDIRDLTAAGGDLCARAEPAANYTLFEGAAANVFDLVYRRDGRREFWVEIVVQDDDVVERPSSATISLDAASVGGDPWRAGVGGGELQIRDATIPSAEVTVSIAYENPMLSTDGSMANLAVIELFNPARSPDPRFTLQTVTLTGLRVTLDGDAGAAMRALRLHTNIGEASHQNAAADSGPQVFEIALSLVVPVGTTTTIILSAMYDNPLGIEDGANIAVSDLVVDALIAPTSGKLELRSVAAPVYANAAGAATADVVATRLEAAVRSVRACDDGALKTLSTVTVTLNCPNALVFEVEAIYLDAIGNEDTAPRAIFLEPVIDGAAATRVNADADGLFYLNDPALLDGVADKADFELSVGSGVLSRESVVFALDFKNTGAEVAEPSFRDDAVLHHQVTAAFKPVALSLINTYTNTHDADASSMSLVVRVDCETVGSSGSASGCVGVEINWDGGDAHAQDDAFRRRFDFVEADGDGAFLIDGLRVLPTLNFSALQSIGADDAQMTVELRIYRRGNDVDTPHASAERYVFLGAASAAAVTVLAPRAADELRHSVENNDDAELDTVANLGESNRVKIADVVLSDGGSDNLSAHIVGLRVLGGGGQIAFALTEDGETTPTALSEDNPLRIADGGSARFNVYAFIDDAVGIADGATVTVSLSVRINFSSDGGATVHSGLAPGPRDLISFAYQVVGTTPALEGGIGGLAERGGERRYDVLADADDLTIALALEDRHGNRDLDDVVAAAPFELALEAGADSGLPVRYDSSFGNGRWLSISTRTFVAGAAGVWRADVPLTAIDDAIKNARDGAGLRLAVRHAQATQVARVGEEFKINYIADAAEITGRIAISPTPASSVNPLTLSGLNLRAYNTWSGQIDVDAAPGAAGDISQAIVDGVSCSYPVRADDLRPPRCEAANVVAVAADADGDGVWTFADGVIFTPALADDAGDPDGGVGELNLNIALPWSFDDTPERNFIAPTESVISALAFQPHKPIVIGFAQTTYQVSETAGSQRLCAQVLSGTIPETAPEIVATWMVDAVASDADEGVDYAAPTRTNTSRHSRDVSEDCVDFSIIDDHIPENEETFQVRITLAWAAPNDGPLLANPDLAQVMIEDDDRIRVRFETGAMVGGVFSTGSVVTEAAGESLLLRVSFWTDEETPQPFRDDLGGQRRIVFGVAAAADSARAAAEACPEVPADLAAGADACLGKRDGDADVDSLSAMANAIGEFSVQMQALYSRRGQHQLFLNILAPRDEEVEGEEVFTIGAASPRVESADPVAVDAVYIADPLNADLAVNVRDAEQPQLLHFDDAGRRVDAFAVAEGASRTYQVAMRDQTSGESLRLKEDFSFTLTVAGAAQAAVTFEDDGDPADGTAVDGAGGVITFTFAAGVAATLTFVVAAAEDDNSLPERGTLNYAHVAGATNVRHPPSLPLTVADNDDAVSPSACVGAIDRIDQLPADEVARDSAQADCLRVEAVSAYAFALRWDEARDRQDPNAVALTALVNADRYRVYLTERAGGAACPPPPARPILRQTAPVVGAVPALIGSARPVGYPLATAAVAALGATITEVFDADGVAAPLQADTRYCALLGVSDGAWMDWAPTAVAVRTVAYSLADANGNGVPDHLELDADYADLDAYLSARCGAASPALDDYDCDNDGVPDILELRFGRAENIRISPTALNCRAAALRTRLATTLPSLDCSGDGVALIDARTLAHAADNGLPAGVPGGVTPMADAPDELGDETFPPGIYWLSNDSADSVLRLRLERAIEMSVAETAALDASLKVRVRALGAQPPAAGGASPAPQVLAPRLLHDASAVAIAPGEGDIDLGEPTRVDEPVSASGVFTAADLTPLLALTDATRVRVQVTWTDAVGPGTLTQVVRLRRQQTTPTLLVGESVSLRLISNNAAVVDGVLSVASPSSTLVLSFQRPADSGVPAGNLWTLTLSGADADAPTRYSDQSAQTRLPGVPLNEDTLRLPLNALGLSALPVRLRVNWSSVCEADGVCYGAREMILIVAAAAPTPTAAAAEALRGYALNGHYRAPAVGDAALEVAPEPGVKIGLGDYAARRCLMQPEVCSGRERAADQGLRLNDAHPACQALGDRTALPCLDFQLFCAEDSGDCMSGAAVDVVFALVAPLEVDHWLYFARPADGGGYISCPFVQNGMPAHVSPELGCPGTDATPAFVQDVVYLDRIYTALNSDAAACPRVGDPSWRSLAELQDAGADLSTANCLRVAYSDGGPNDAAEETGLIADPMAVGFAQPRVPAQLEISVIDDALTQPARGESVVARFRIRIIDNLGDDDRLSNIAVTLSAVSDDGTQPAYPSEFAVPRGGGVVEVAWTPVADAMLTVTASLTGVENASASARVTASSVLRAPARLRLAPDDETLRQSMFGDALATRVGIRIVDNLGADDVLPATTVTLTIVASAGEAPTHPRQFRVPPGGDFVSITLIPTVDTTLSLTVSLVGVEDASVDVRVVAALEPQSEIAVFDATTPTAALPVGAAPAHPLSAASLVAVDAPLMFIEGELRTYELRLLNVAMNPVSATLGTALNFELSGEGGDAYKISAAGGVLPAEPTGAVAAASFGVGGAVFLRVRSLQDADGAVPPPAALRVSQSAGGPIPNLPLSLSLQTADDEADTARPFASGDTAGFRLRTSASEAAAGAYVSFDLSADLGVSEDCENPHCAINLMAVEIVWDNTHLTLDTDPDDDVVAADTDGKIYYEAHGTRSDETETNADQPDTHGRLRMSQAPGLSDYDLIYLAREATQSKVVVVLLDSFEDTDREIRCDSEDATSPRYCEDFQLLHFGLFVDAGLELGAQASVEARLWRIDTQAVNLSLLSRGREVILGDAVSPMVVYTPATATIEVIAPGDAALALTAVEGDAPTLSTLESASAPTTVAFVVLDDAGDDALPTLLTSLDLKFAEDADSRDEVLNLRIAISGPGLTAAVVGEKITGRNAFRFDFSAAADGGLLTPEGAARVWRVSAWMHDPGPPNVTYEDRTAFTIVIEDADSLMRRREHVFSDATPDAARDRTNFALDIVATQILFVRSGGGEDFALRIPSDAELPRGALRAADIRGSRDSDYTGSWRLRLADADIGAVSAASYSFVDGESAVDDARIDFTPVYGADNHSSVLTFAADLPAPSVSLQLAAEAQSLIVAAEPALSNDPAAGLRVSASLEAVAFYKEEAAGDCRAFARNCVLDEDFNSAVTITPSVGLVGQTLDDLAPVSAVFVDGRATLDLDLSAASLPTAGELQVSLAYPELQSGAAFFAAEATIAYDFRSRRLAFEAAPTLVVAEAAAAQEICVTATPANDADATPIELSVALIGGDAVAGEDYALAVGSTFSLSIGPGESRACQALTLLDDVIAEHDEHLEFQIAQVAYVVAVGSTATNSTATRLVRSEDTLRLVIRDDDDITVRIAPSAVELRERAAAGGRVPASANLNISLWDGVNAERFSDDLGGRRELRFNIVTGGAASLAGLCPADSRTILADGSDFCLRLPAAAAEGVALSAVDTGGGATFSLAYQRNGADRFVVEIVAPGGDALEGADAFEISIDGLDPSTDTTYVWQATAAAPNLGDDNLSVAMSILDAEEAAPVLVGPDGQALTAVTLAETTPSVVFHVELRETDGAVALVPDEDVGVEITLGDLPGVSFVDLSTSTVALSTATRTLNLVIAANAMRTASFRLLARADDNDVSESGTLDLLARSGGAASPLPADAMASVDVTVTDADASAVPFVLDYDQSGNVNISDGLILGRLMAGIIAFETNFSSILNRFFAENAPPGTLVADSMLLDLISEEATADAERLLSDRTLRDEALQSVLFIYFNYSDDLDLDKSGNLNISDGLILGRLVAGVIAAEVSFGPGFPNFFNPDGSLNKGLDPGTLDLFYVDVEADATGILPNEAVRREAIEKVLEIYVRAGFSFTD